MENMEQQLQKVLKENNRLKKEISFLKGLLKSNHIPLVQEKNEGLDYVKEQKIKERINIFKNLFKGREDVYAFRFELDNGKVGYSPSRNKAKNFNQLTDQVIYDHLSGKKTIGIYPLLRDGTCWFLAVDFDKKYWKEDAMAFTHVCKEWGIPTNMEISRSGNGCHVWIFFQNPISATLARKLGRLIMNRAVEINHNRFVSYDRMFPNQDSLPKGGLGNLIALPMQHKPRKLGNSIFVDENFNAYPDQWKFLANIKKINKQKLEEIINTFSYDGTVAEIFNESKPTKLTAIVKNGIYISKQDMTLGLFQQVVKLVSFNNPAFYKVQSQRLSTNNIPRIINCADEQEGYVILPRGCMKDLMKLLKENSVELHIEDRSNIGKEINVSFHGDLRAQQEDAVNKLIQHSNGILSATTGFGKTVVAASLISKRKVNTLIIVHRKQLMEQWKERLTAFLNIDENVIGQIGGGKNSTKGTIDIATIQSLNNKGEVKDIVKNYGQVIVDECHHISAFTFETVLKKVEAKYVHGLTATPSRKDGLQLIMKMQCGPISYKVTAKEQAKILPFKHVLLPRYTNFKCAHETIQAISSELIKDEKRNDMIFNDVLHELEQGATPIILTERIEHVKTLESMFKSFAKNVIVLTGGMRKTEEKDKIRQLESIPNDQELLVIATGKYLGEGFDYARLDTMFLTMPISWKGTLQQYVGRLHRLHDGKEVVKVYDYVDHRIEMLSNMFEKRRKGYQTLGYVLEEPGSKKRDSAEQMRLF